MIRNGFKWKHFESLSNACMAQEQYMKANWFRGMLSNVLYGEPVSVSQLTVASYSPPDKTRAGPRYLEYRTSYCKKLKIRDRNIFCIAQRRAGPPLQAT